MHDSVTFFSVFHPLDVAVAAAVVFQQEDVSVQLEALDILGDLLSRFGGQFANLNQGTFIAQWFNHLPDVCLS